MSFGPASLPVISISPPPPEEPIAEPYSPFASMVYPDDADGYRHRLLTPPSSAKPGRNRLSPPSSCESFDEEDDFTFNEGLDHQRFEALLQASRERNAGGGRKELDLRREVAYKAHRAKQNERRALFISKILALPSNQLMSNGRLPVATPNSPKCNAPPGIPFPTLYDEKFECIPDRVQAPKPDKYLVVRQGHATPSLDEITARMTAQGYICVPLSEKHPVQPLNSLHLNSDFGAVQRKQSRLPASVGRLQTPTQDTSNANSPMGHQALSFPNYGTKSTAAQLADSTRASRAHDMLCTLRRRTLHSNYIVSDHGVGEHDKSVKWKRHSAPGDLFPLRERLGFQHPVLSMPGGF
ncbi:hypothetical protein AX17_000313 [Amanita inopinata Kibby_2008]|nr:hypothetical protein AX17_000313 [Amanita inopinata Kibby_2008]